MSLPSNKLPPSQHPPQIHFEAAAQPPLLWSAPRKALACEPSGLSPHVVPFPDGHCKEHYDMLQTEVVLVARPCTCLSVAQHIGSLY